MAEAPKDWKNTYGDRRGAAGFVNAQGNFFRNRKKIEPGERRGSLVVLQKITVPGSRHPRYQVQCDCGRIYELAGTSLSNARQCKKCAPQGAAPKYGEPIKNSKLYRLWVGMRRRCNPDVEDFRNRHWAKRGIKVCAQWQDYAVFSAWAMAHGYREGLSIDRINVNGDYEPSNCEWVTRSENSKRCRAGFNIVRKTHAAHERHFPIEMMWGDA